MTTQQAITLYLTIEALRNQFKRENEIMRIKDDTKLAPITGGIPYTFHRADGFYSLQFGSDEEAKVNGECNPGTLKVVNELTQDVVYEA